MSEKIRLLAVTFQTPFSESETLTSILAYFRENPKSSPRFSLKIWDNSPECREDDFKEYSSGLNIESRYISTPENTPLCQVYNNSIDQRDGFDYLCILDQDTQLTFEYFDELIGLANKGTNLALPQIRSDGFLYSPSHRKYCLGRHFSDIAPGVRSSVNMLAINSGMMIKCAVFEKVRYDDRIKFYGTDTWFMVQYERSFHELTVMNSTLNHSLRVRESNTKEWRRNYYRNQIHINRIVFDGGIIEKIVTRMYCIYLRIFYARD